MVNKHRKIPVPSFIYSTYIMVGVMRQTSVKYHPTEAQEEEEAHGECNEEDNVRAIVGNLLRAPRFAVAHTNCALPFMVRSCSGPPAC